jgi:hypothetical protein
MIASQDTCSPMIFMSQKGFEKRLIAAMKARGGDTEHHAQLMEKRLKGDFGEQVAAIERNRLAMAKRYHGTTEQYLRRLCRSLKQVHKSDL